jgi:hypothetical protein
MARFDIKKINDDAKETKRLKISKRIAASEKVHGSRDGSRFENQYLLNRVQTVKNWDSINADKMKNV